MLLLAPVLVDVVVLNGKGGSEREFEVDALRAKQEDDAEQLS